MPFVWIISKKIQLRVGVEWLYAEVMLNLNPFLVHCSACICLYVILCWQPDMSGLKNLRLTPLCQALVRLFDQCPKTIFTLLPGASPTRIEFYFMQSSSVYFSISLLFNIYFLYIMCYWFRFSYLHFNSLYEPAFYPYLDLLCFLMMYFFFS